MIAATQKKYDILSHQANHNEEEIIMRGRKPVPSVLRELHGNPRKVAMPKNEPKPVGDLSEPPEWLSEGQRTSWYYVMAHSPLGLLKQIDRGALLTWVVAEDLHCQASIAQSKCGLLTLVKTKASAAGADVGLLSASPYINIINQQAKIMLKAASELGFTPVSRPRIAASQALAAEPSWPAPGEKATPGVSLDAFLASHPVGPVKH